MSRLGLGLGIAVAVFYVGMALRTATHPIPVGPRAHSCQGEVDADVMAAVRARSEQQLRRLAAVVRDYRDGHYRTDPHSWCAEFIDGVSEIVNDEVSE